MSLVDSCECPEGRPTGRERYNMPRDAPGANTDGRTLEPARKHRRAGRGRLWTGLACRTAIPCGEVEHSSEGSGSPHKPRSPSLKETVHDLGSVSDRGVDELRESHLGMLRAVRNAANSRYDSRRRRSAHAALEGRVIALDSAIALLSAMRSRARVRELEVKARTEELRQSKQQPGTKSANELTFAFVLPTPPRQGSGLCRGEKKERTSFRATRFFVPSPIPACGR